MFGSERVAIALGASMIALLPFSSVLAQQRPTQGSSERTILFVCEHGTAKSVIAAAHFNRLAKSSGSAYRAIAEGLHPDKQMMPNVKAGLDSEGLDISGWQPKPFNEEDAGKAERVVTIGCALPSSKSVTRRKLQEWNDVPSPSAEYQNASKSIAERVSLLFWDLEKKSQSR